MKFQNSSLIFLCILLASGCATLTEQKTLTPKEMYQIGQSYYVAHEYSQAIVWFQQAAGEGYAAAQVKLAWMLYNGEGTKQDWRAARYWYEEAALQGDGGAQNNLAVMLNRCEGGEKDPKRAFLWYYESAEQGNSTAQYNLGKSYLYGTGVEKDVAQAREWLQKAADGGNANAAELLKIFHNGTQDSNTAMYKSKYFGQSDSEKQQKGHETNFTPEEMYQKGYESYQSKDFKTARYWYEKAAHQGDAVAQNNLGVMLSKGEGGRRDPRKAVAWYAKSAKQGDSVAQSNLGLSYLNGTGVKQNVQKGKYWLQKAADAGYETAIKTLASLENKKHTKKKHPIIANAAEQTFSEGLKYFNGKGVAQNHEKAFSLFHKAAKQKYPPAQYYAGMMYEQGLGTERDLVKACVWYSRAAKRGDSMASERYNSLDKHLTQESRRNISQYE